MLILTLFLDVFKNIFLFSFKFKVLITYKLTYESNKITLSMYIILHKWLHKKIIIIKCRLQVPNQNLKNKTLMLKLNNKQKKIKNKIQVKFRYVETKYYKKRAGFHTTQPDIQIVACYEPFTANKMYFNDHDSKTCGDCFLKFQSGHADKVTNIIIIKNLF